LLAENFGSLEELATPKPRIWEKVAEVGPKVSEAIVEFFSEPANRKLIKKLQAAGVRPTAEKREIKSQKFAGKSFVFTGPLSTAAVKKQANSFSSTAASSQRLRQQKTDYVVVGADPWLQIRKAKDSRNILTESNFEKLIGLKKDACLAIHSRHGPRRLRRSRFFADGAAELAAVLLNEFAASSRLRCSRAP